MYRYFCLYEKSFMVVNIADISTERNHVPTIEHEKMDVYYEEILRTNRVKYTAYTTYILLCTYGYEKTIRAI